MNSTHTLMLSVSNRSKFSDPPGKWGAVRRNAVSFNKSPSSRPEIPFPDKFWASRTSGVRAPLSRVDVEGVEVEGMPFVFSSDGDNDLGVEISLPVPDPRVAAIEGDEGGSDDRVK